MAKAKKTNKKWMQEARKRMERKGTVGKFTKYCKRLGYKGVTQECINKAKKSNNPTLVKEAVYAENARKIAKKRKRKKK